MMMLSRVLYLLALLLSAACVCGTVEVKPNDIKCVVLCTKCTKRGGKPFCPKPDASLPPVISVPGTQDPLTGGDGDTGAQNNNSSGSTGSSALSPSLPDAGRDSGDSQEKAKIREQEIQVKGEVTMPSTTLLSSSSDQHTQLSEKAAQPSITPLSDPNKVSQQGSAGQVGDGAPRVATDNSDHSESAEHQTNNERASEEKTHTPGSDQAGKARETENETQSQSSTESSTSVSGNQENSITHVEEKASVTQGSQSNNGTSETNNSVNTNSVTHNTASNGESTTTTTTTTTPTTLPPVPANKKPNVKGDADSSSISSMSSVWVRVPLLIVVALACILV